MPATKAKEKAVDKPCNCMVCQHSREFHRIVKKLEDPIDRKIMFHFWDVFANLEEDSEVWQAKAEGSWPGWEHNSPKCR